jgi:hypothetical protein
MKSLIEIIIQVRKEDLFRRGKQAPYIGYRGTT